MVRLPLDGGRRLGTSELTFRMIANNQLSSYHLTRYSAVDKHERIEHTKECLLFLAFAVVSDRVIIESNHWISFHSARPESVPTVGIHSDPTGE